MEGLSKYLRLRTAAIAALVGAGLALTMMPGAASADRCPTLILCVKNVSIGVRNSSKTPIMVQWCPNGHTSIDYKFGTAFNPCDVITETYVVEPGKRHIFANANPAGVIIQPAYRFGPSNTGVKDKILYFYVSNPYVGLPFFRAQGRKVALAPGHAEIHQVDTVTVELRRYHDEDRDGESVKLMRIEIQKWPGAA